VSFTQASGTQPVLKRVLKLQAPASSACLGREADCTCARCELACPALAAVEISAAMDQLVEDTCDAVARREAGAALGDLVTTVAWLGGRPWRDPSARGLDRGALARTLKPPPRQRRVRVLASSLHRIATPRPLGPAGGVAAERLAEAAARADAEDAVDALVGCNPRVRVVSPTGLCLRRANFWEDDYGLHRRALEHFLRASEDGEVEYVWVFPEGYVEECPEAEPSRSGDDAYRMIRPDAAGAATDSMLRVFERAGLSGNRARQLVRVGVLVSLRIRRARANAIRARTRSRVRRFRGGRRRCNLRPDTTARSRGSAARALFRDKAAPTPPPCRGRC